MRLRHHSRRVRSCALKCGLPEDQSNDWGHCAECDASWRSSPEYSEYQRAAKLGFSGDMIEAHSRWSSRRWAEVDPAHDGGVL